MCTNNMEFKNIGIWMSEKKSQKLNWTEFSNVCKRHGYTLLKLNLEQSLEEQGPLDVFIHKLTDIIAAADQGDEKAKTIITNVEKYISMHRDLVVIDPLENVRLLLDRCLYYSMLESQKVFKRHGVFIPPFVEITSTDITENLMAMKVKGVVFPVVCKPNVAHGSKSAHIMSVIFNERGLSQCALPCVLQNFINHNAVLYKIFIMGESFSIAERPSLKNFYPCDVRDSIHFFSGDVCKADSQSSLSILDPHDRTCAEKGFLLEEDKIKCIINILKSKLNMSLFGFDIVIDNTDGKYAIIDINVFPGYDNFPDFFENMLRCVDGVVLAKSLSICKNVHNGELRNSDRIEYVSDDDIDALDNLKPKRIKKCDLINVGVISLENNSNILHYLTENND